MPTDSLHGKNIWITGASSGIGLEMSLYAARAGGRLHLFSSRPEPLADAARLCGEAGALSVGFDAADLSDMDLAVAVAQKVLAETGPPDYVILNAGVSQRSSAGETDPEVTRRILNLNFLSAAVFARVLIPAMTAAGGGCFGVTSSVTGVFGFPLRSAYAASKHALHGYFESVSLEYSHQGIRVTMAVPGRIRTPISLNALDGSGGRYGRMDSVQAKGMDAAICARRYWNAVVRGRREIVIGGLDTLMVFFHRYLPWLFHLIASRVSPV